MLIVSLSVQLGRYSRLRTVKQSYKHLVLIMLNTNTLVSYEIVISGSIANELPALTY